jgi:uncharacterized protein (TIGR03435 family)
MRACAVLLISACTAVGQPPAGRLKFEVASVKPHQGAVPEEGGRTEISGRRLTIVFYSLLGLVMRAYDVKRDQVSSLTPLDETMYDIFAEGESGQDPTAGEFRTMLQALLADRFKLKAHRETRDTPVYALVVDKGGPKLRASAKGGEPARTLGLKGVNYQVTMTNVNGDYLTDYIRGSAGLDRPVMNRTRLTGSYDLQLTYTSEYRINGAMLNGLEAISIFEAVRDQLGLRLERKVAPYEFVVIDHAEKASEN